MLQSLQKCVRDFYQQDFLYYNKLLYKSICFLVMCVGYLEIGFLGTTSWLKHWLEIETRSAPYYLKEKLFNHKNSLSVLQSSCKDNPSSELLLKCCLVLCKQQQMRLCMINGDLTLVGGNWKVLSTFKSIM